MRNFLTARWRRYAVAFVVAAASLGVIAACNPTKKQPPPPTPCGTGVAACLTISPTEAFFSLGDIKTFTVKNLGPNPTPRLHEAALDAAGVGGSGVFLINSAPGANSANPDDCQDFHTSGLVVGEQCTVKVLAVGNPGNAGTLIVGADNTQIDPGTGQRGVTASLTRL